jgi:putative transcriptional regulator
VTTVQKKLFERLVLSMRQMDEVGAGRRKPSRRFEVEPASIKALRAQTGLSQAKFAELLSVDLGTLRNWEQGRREPTGPAKALLRAIHRDPENVLRALAG